MRTATFPTKAAAEAFANELLQAGISPTAIHEITVTPEAVVTPEISHTLAENELRSAEVALQTETPAEGARTGLGVGALGGAALGTVLSIASGGIALPFILGLAALGAATGAAGGAVEGALEQEQAEKLLRLSDAQRQYVTERHSAGEISVAVDASIDPILTDALATKYGGHFF